MPGRTEAARPEKVEAVEEIRAKLADSDATVLTEYRGLTVRAIADLRTSLRGAGAEYKVFKNTLARRAVDEAGIDGLASMLEGPVAIAFVRGDAVAAAKALREFGRSNPALIVKGGLLGERVMTAGDLDKLADVAPREVLLAQLAGAFQAPLVKAAGLFQAFPRNFAYGLKALVDQRIAGGEAPPEAGSAVEAEAPAAESVAESTDEAPAGDTADTADTAASADEPSEPTEASAPDAEPTPE